MSESAKGELASTQGKRVGLEIKLVIALLVVSLLPLTVSALLVGNIGEVAQNFASHHVETLRPHLDQAQDAYRQVITAKKAEFEAVAQRLAAHDVLAPMQEGESELSRDEIASALLVEHDDLVAVRIIGSAGAVLGKSTRISTLPVERVRELAFQEAIGSSGASLELVFAADMQPVLDLRALGAALETSRQVDTLKSSLPDSYRNAFLLLVGGVVVVVTILALLFARRISRRIALLVAGTRDVARGDLGARVALGGQDEFAERLHSIRWLVICKRNARRPCTSSESGLGKTSRGSLLMKSRIHSPPFSWWFSKRSHPTLGMMSATKAYSRAVTKLFAKKWKG